MLDVLCGRGRQGRELASPRAPGSVPSPEPSGTYLQGTGIAGSRPGSHRSAAVLRDTGRSGAAVARAAGAALAPARNRGFPRWGYKTPCSPLRQGPTPLPGRRDPSGCLTTLRTQAPPLPPLPGPYQVFTTFTFRYSRFTSRLPRVAASLEGSGVWMDGGSGASGWDPWVPLPACTTLPLPDGGEAAGVALKHVGIVEHCPAGVSPSPPPRPRSDLNRNSLRHRTSQHRWNRGVREVAPRWTQNAK